MMTLTVADQLAALRGVVFGAVEQWNAQHPHPLRSHQEHAAVHVTQVYGDATSVPSYTVTVVCGLSGAPQLAFHGADLAAVIEHARLTLEHRIAVELAQRAEKLRDAEFDCKYGVAV
jgi:hypothetical protein